MTEKERMAEEAIQGYIEVEYKGETLQLCYPTNKQMREAEQIERGALWKYLKGDPPVPSRIELEKHFSEKGLWTDADEKALQSALEHMLLVRYDIQGMEDAEAVAGKKAEYAGAVDKYLILHRRKESMFLNSAEALAEGDKTAYLLAVCVCQKGGAPYWCDMAEVNAASPDREFNRLVTRATSYWQGLPDDFFALLRPSQSGENATASPKKRRRPSSPKRPQTGPRPD